MADRDHPKTHVEDQDLDEVRKQPLSPLHEGIDPLTEGDTMLPREDVKGNAAKFNKKEEARAAEENEEASEKLATDVADQEELKARANTPNASLPEDQRTQTTEEKAKVEDKTASGDTTDKETGTENTSVSNKTEGKTSADEVKAAEKPVSSNTPKSGTTDSKTSSR